MKCPYLQAEGAISCAKMGADLVATENHVAVTHRVNPAADAVL